MRQFLVGLFLIGVVGAMGYDRAMTRRTVLRMAADIDDLDRLFETQGNHLYTVMDTEIRILHHVIPHKAQVQGCPECFAYRKMHEDTAKERAMGLDDPRKSSAWGR